MNSKSNFLAGLVLAAIFSVAAPTASAQVVRQGTSSAGTLIPVAPGFTSLTQGTATQSLFFDAQLSGATINSWIIEGDYTILSASLTTNLLQFQATNYGKIRVTVGYYITTGTATCGTCTYNVRTYASKVYEFYKIFSTWPNDLGGVIGSSPLTISGPPCISGGSSVVYSIFPVVSQAGQIAKNIGLDTYSWVVITQSGVSPTLTYPSGDKSSIAFTAPAETFKVRVVVGQANGTLQPTFGASPTGAEKVLLVTSTAALPTSTNFPSCVATNVSSINFSFTGLTSGAQYTIQSTVGGTFTGTGLTISPTGVFIAGSTSPQPLTLAGINSNIGDVFVTPVGGCNPTPARFSVARNLSANNVLGPVACQDGSTNPIQFSISNPPGAPVYSWTFPTGWTPAAGTSGSANQLSAATLTTVNTTQPSLQLTPNAPYTSGPMVKVRTATCTTNLSLTLNVNGAPAGCSASAVPGAATYVITRNFGPGGPNTNAIGFSIDPTAPCATALPYGSGVQLYTWNVLTGGTVVNGVYTGGVPLGGNFQRTSDVPTVNFGQPVPNPSFIRVTVIEPGSCLNITITTPPPGARPGPTPTADPTKLPAVSRNAATALTQGLNVYPNPTGNTLNVELPDALTASLQLFDQTGRVVYENQATTGRTAVNVKDLPAGQYALRVTANGRTTYRAVQVQH